MMSVRKTTFFLLIAAASLVLSCRNASPRTDAPRPRIVTYSPALTGMVFEMGFGEHVVGVTTFCRVPAGHEDLPTVGNLTHISTEAILSVAPDVVLVQQDPAAFAAVTNIDPAIRIEHFTIETLSDIASAMERIGRIVGEERRATESKLAFEDKLERIRRRSEGSPRPRTLFVIGYDRPSTGGSGTFIDEMIELSGGINAAALRGYSGWKTLNRENILAMRPEVLICQVPSAQENEAMEYWRTFGDLQAVKANRIHTVTDERWTIPSVWSADFAGRLSEILRLSEGTPGDSQ